MKPRMQGVLVVAMTLVGIDVISGSSADATMPGDNGRIAFSLDTGSGFQINTIRPNGTGLKQLASVTVLHRRCMQADALATALLVLGPDDGFALAERLNLAARFVMRHAVGFEETMTPAMAAMLA